MCGIVGYIGEKNSIPILMDGLKKLEYRGYDSAGIACLHNSDIILQKTAGKISALENLLSGKNIFSKTGLGHTRWATHGEPTDLNAHPHLDCTSKIAVVHNGIIENFSSLKKFLEKQGHNFITDTDTEVLAHLIEEHFKGDLLEAVRMALTQVEGTYGIGVVCLDTPDRIVAARLGSPLVVGRGQGENFLASDVSAILQHTNQVVYLDEHELAEITKDNFTITRLDKTLVDPNIQDISWSLDMIEKSGSPHFMHKEIMEQPTTLHNAMRGRLSFKDGTTRLNGLNVQYKELAQIRKVIITACGTSWHAALIGEYLIEEFARLPVEVEYASEFRYRNPIINPNTILFVISQSGETADTLAALREAKRKGATCLGICNVVGSTITRESDGGVYIHAGPEIGVASTKAFTSQIMVLSLITILLARMRHMSFQKGVELIKAVQKVPTLVNQVLEKNDEIKRIAEKYYRKNNFLYLGRGLNFPVALEGALKLKELSYIHAEGYPAAEMKHGPIALIDKNTPTVVMAPKDSVYDKIISNIQEIKARKGDVIAIATEGDNEIKSLVNDVVYIPKAIEFILPVISIIPLQLLAYHMAVLRGCDVDQPRNLAKSVTVE